jgi:hypothetical protein
MSIGVLGCPSLFVLRVLSKKLDHVLIYDVMNLGHQALAKRLGFSFQCLPEISLDKMEKLPA